MNTPRIVSTLLLWATGATIALQAQTITSPVIPGREVPIGPDCQECRERIWSADRAFWEELRKLKTVDPQLASRLETSYRQIRQQFRLKSEDRADMAGVDWLVFQLDSMGLVAHQGAEAKVITPPQAYSLHAGRYPFVYKWLPPTAD